MQPVVNNESEASTRGASVERHLRGREAAPDQLFTVKAPASLMDPI
ncbi:hypothetical protein GWI33_003843, partial [Rhynchophorus ferrugineus]